MWHQTEKRRPVRGAHWARATGYLAEPVCCQTSEPERSPSCWTGSSLSSRRRKHLYTQPETNNVLNSSCTGSDTQTGGPTRKAQHVKRYRTPCVWLRLAKPLTLRLTAKSVNWDPQSAEGKAAAALSCGNWAELHVQGRNFLNVINRKRSEEIKGQRKLKWQITPCRSYELWEQLIQHWGHANWQKPGMQTQNFYWNKMKHNECSFGFNQRDDPRTPPTSVCAAHGDER